MGRFFVAGCVLPGRSQINVTFILRMCRRLPVCVEIHFVSVCIAAHSPGYQKRLALTFDIWHLGTGLCLSLRAMRAS